MLPLIHTHAALAAVAEEAVLSPAVIGAIVIGLIVVTLVIISLMALTLVAEWKLFKKAGMPGWTVFIPFYNYVKLLELSGAPLWWALMMFVPIANIVFAIRALNRLSRVFGKSQWFTAGLVFLPFVFLPILGFGKSEYTKPKKPEKMSDAVQYTLLVLFAFLLLNGAYTAGVIVGTATSATHPLRQITDTDGSPSYYATDGTYVYYADTMTEANPDGFRVLSTETQSTEYAVDADNAYYAGTTIGTAESFAIIDAYYAKNAKHVYYDGKELPSADPTTFSVIKDETGSDSDYAKDQKYVYFGGKVIPDADVATFELILSKEGWGTGYARDAHTVYRDGEAIHGANPKTFKLPEPRYTEGE